ncbi:MAG: DHA1 family bicyclomycin/chloramphenicol resistance-like MFS transporter [Alphaproteobacteria bacterium]|jgi:DHA1 family bicyclomycin/chloramphenicol resistance-like MFS transporter
MDAPARPAAPMPLLVAMMVSSQVAITIFLPSLPSMAEDLGTSQTAVQIIISAYLGAFALAQLVVGPLSDAFGRRRPLLVGLVLFTAASIACAAAPNITFLIIARIFQAMGGCAGIVIARAIIRDTTDSAGSTKAIAYLGMALGVTPAVAPLIGGQLEVAFGWQASFLATAALGAAVTVATLATLQETLLPADRRTTRVGDLVRTYMRLVRLPVFVGYGLSVGFTGAAFQAFIAGAPVAFIVVMGVPPQSLGLYIISVAVAYVIGNFASSRLSYRVGRNKMIAIGSALNVGGTLLSVVLALAGLATPISLIIPLMIYSCGSGFVVPNALAGGLNIVEPANAGAAAALSGFAQMTCGFLSTLIVAALVQTSFLQVGLVMTASVSIAWLCFFFLVTRRS